MRIGIFWFIVAVLLFGAIPLAENLQISGPEPEKRFPSFRSTSIDHRIEILSEVSRVGAVYVISYSFKNGSRKNVEFIFRYPLSFYVHLGPWETRKMSIETRKIPTQISIDRVAIIERDGKEWPEGGLGLFIYAPAPPKKLPSIAPKGVFVFLARTCPHTY